MAGALTILIIIAVFFVAAGTVGRRFSRHCCIVAGPSAADPALARENQSAESVALSLGNRPTGSDGGETIMTDLMIAVGVLLGERSLMLRGRGAGPRGGDRGPKPGDL